MHRDELAAQAQIPAEDITRYEALGLWKAAARDVLESLGFSGGQIARALNSGVSTDQLRGMLRYRQAVDPRFDGADIAARIERIEELDKLALDSHLE